MSTELFKYVTKKLNSSSKYYDCQDINILNLNNIKITKICTFEKENEKNFKGANAIIFHNREQFHTV